MVKRSRPTLTLAVLSISGVAAARVVQGVAGGMCPLAFGIVVVPAPGRRRSVSAVSA